MWTLAHAVNNCISTTGSDDMCSKDIGRFIGNSRTCTVCIRIKNILVLFVSQ